MREADIHKSFPPNSAVSFGTVSDNSPNLFEGSLCRDNVALVTGASRGIGQRITQVFRNYGVRVTGISLNNPATDANQWFRCDVSQENEVATTIKRITESFGRIDILVNCAGVACHASLTQTSFELWTKTLAVNLTGTFLVMREVLPIMLQQGRGRIINIASAASKRGEPQMVAYSTSKHALIGLTRSVALEVAKTDITVNAICPGPVPTDLLHEGLMSWSRSTGRPTEVARKIFQASSPQNRFFETDEVAALVAFLASHSARGINGQAINLCGGAVVF